jgi:N-acetylneuraminate lyase
MYDLLNAVHGRFGNFAGIKYTHEDMMDYLSCLHFENGHYNILWGRDESYLSALACGAKGAVGSTFNYAAPLYHDLMEAFNSGNLENASLLQQQSIDMIRLLGKYGGIGTGKVFMKAIGFDCGPFRLPVSNVNEKAYRLFLDDLNRVDFFSFCSRMPENARM